MSQSDPLQNTAKNRSALEEIAMMIPGFQGYLKAEHRREADRLQREYLCTRLDESRQKITQAVATWTDDNRFDNLVLGSKVGDILQRTTAKVRNADQGYSGFFATTHVDEVALATLYEVDKHMLSYVKDIEKACTDLDPDADDASNKASLKAIRSKTEELEVAFSRRKDAITGVA